MADNLENPWKTLSEQQIYENPWISLEEHQVVNPGGGEGIYGKVKFKNLAIGVIPIDENQNTWLVGQYRYTLNEFSWEIPMGGGPLQQDPLDSAKRELQEETGMVANKWERIMKIHTSNSVTDEVGYVYLAEELTPGPQQLDQTETGLQVWKLPFQKALEMVLNDKITDSLSVAGILKLARSKNL